MRHAVRATLRAGADWIKLATTGAARQAAAMLRCGLELDGRLLGEAGEMLSGLSRCAGIVLVDKQSKTLKHVEFVSLGQGKALAVLVGEDGDVENRIIALPDGLPLSSLHEASNYVNARIGGLTLADARVRIELEIEQRRAQLDELTARVVTEGLATWSGDGADHKSLIVCGRAHLLALGSGHLFTDDTVKPAGTIDPGPPYISAP